ncbi:hexosaminidase, partial [Phenoliferia sp. Uapishka_3]
MPRSIANITLCAALGFAWLSTRASAVWPAPREVYDTGTTPLLLSADFDITFAPTANMPSPIPPDLTIAVTRAKSYLLNDNLRRTVVGRGEGDRASLRGALYLDRLELVVLPSATGTTNLSSLHWEAGRPYGDLNEGYMLEVPTGEEGSPANPIKEFSSATLSASNSLGLLRGLQTFVQLVYFLPAGSDTASLFTSGYFEVAPALRYILNTPIMIVDSPAFPHRGFMLDTSRSYYTVLDIERTLEIMSWSKLNVFHWHVTDAQSWPLFLPNYPNLTEAGAYSPGEIYTPQDLTNLEALADSFGIRIMLEVDMPGHTASIAESFPEAVACAFLKSWSGYGNEPPTGQLKLGDAAVQSFAENISRTAAGLVTGIYFSTGGDEINTKCYSADPTMNATTIASDNSINAGLKTFVHGIHDAVRELNKTPVVWEEMVLSHQLNLANDTIVMVWISSQNVANVVQEGYRVIHAASNYFYLDCGAGGWLGNAPDLQSWCLFNTWAHSYSFDPYADIDPQHRHLILGGQSLLWSEQTDSNNLDSIAWPRGAVAAEVFWTGHTLANGSPRNLSEALPRLHDWRYRAVSRGAKAIPLQPEWCALRPGACDL